MVEGWGDAYPELRERASEVRDVLGGALTQLRVRVAPALHAGRGRWKQQVEELLRTAPRRDDVKSEHQGEGEH